MLSRLMEVVFGCWHSNYSFPITAKGRARGCNAAASLTGTYVVCLDCGKEMPYDWRAMRVLAPVPEVIGAEQHPALAKHAA